MGKKSPSMPAPPDPVKTAEAQAAANKETAIAQAQLNMIDQYTPYGSLVYSPIQGTGPTFNQAAYDSALAAYNQSLANSSQQTGGSRFGRPGGGRANNNVGGPFGGGNALKPPNPADFYMGGSDVPRYAATQTLSPNQQKLLNLTEQAGIQFGNIANTQLGAIDERLSQPLDFSSLGPAPTANEDTRQSVLDSIIGRLQPQADRDRDRLETRLANQGISYGSEAWMRAMDDYNRSQNDLRLAANAFAGNEMAQLYGLEANQRDRAINEMIQQRQIPINELMAMLGGSQVQAPNFVGTPQTQIAGTPLADSVYGSYQGQLQNYAAQQQANAARTQGLFGLLGTGAMAWAMSDRRLKRNIERIGTWANGLAVYAYQYLWSDEPQIGFMADEVARLHPHAVARIGEYLAVDYSEAVKC